MVFYTKCTPSCTQTCTMKNNMKNVEICMKLITCDCKELAAFRNPIISLPSGSIRLNVTAN